MKIVELKREMDTRFREVHVRLDQLESRVTADYETTRRYMQVLIEELKSEYRLGLDQMRAMEGRLASVVASNASDHTVFTPILQQHEVRISALETKDNPSDPHA